MYQLKTSSGDVTSFIPKLVRRHEKSSPMKIVKDITTCSGKLLSETTYEFPIKQLSDISYGVWLQVKTTEKHLANLIDQYRITAWEKDIFSLTGHQLEFHMTQTPAIVHGSDVFIQLPFQPCYHRIGETKYTVHVKFLKPGIDAVLFVNELYISLSGPKFFPDRMETVDYPMKVRVFKPSDTNSTIHFKNVHGFVYQTVVFFEDLDLHCFFGQPGLEVHPFKSMVQKIGHVVTKSDTSVDYWFTIDKIKNQIPITQDKYIYTCTTSQPPNVIHDEFSVTKFDEQTLWLPNSNIDQCRVGKRSVKVEIEWSPALYGRNINVHIWIVRSSIVDPFTAGWNKLV